jgi:hypothetical protein
MLPGELSSISGKIGGSIIPLTRRAPRFFQSEGSYPVTVGDFSHFLRENTP